MKMNRLELLQRYGTILREIETEKARMTIESLYKKFLEEKIQAEIQEKINNGTASVLNHYRFCFKSEYFDFTDRSILDRLINTAKNLSMELFGNSPAFPTIKYFLKRLIKKIKKLLKYLLNTTKSKLVFFEDKRIMISRFKRLLIKVTQDDVDNSTTQIRCVINRVLNFYNVQNGNIIGYKKSNYKYISMQ